MTIKIKETGEMKELAYLTDGMDGAADYIGNTGAFQDGQFVSHEDGYMVAELGTFTWWNNQITEQIALDARIADLKNTHDAELVDATITNSLDGIEFNDAVKVANGALDEVFA